MMRARLFLCGALTLSLFACGDSGDATPGSAGSGAATSSSAASGGGDATTSAGAGGNTSSSSSGAGGATSATSGATTSGVGGAGGAGGGAGGDSGELFDMPMIRDASTAQCAFDNPHSVFKDGVQLDVWNVSYVSWESIAGQLTPILIRGFAAKPQGQAAGLPAVVQAHGLGGFSKESDATTTAALLGTFVLAYTGPGGGDAADNTSEGLSSGANNGYRMFDTLPDTRGSWFWGHAVAAMRGLTCLAARPEVDPARMGMTGFSGGAVATLIAAGVDDRIKAAVPLSGTHAWSVATQAPEAWQHSLLTAAGLTTQSAEWVKLQTDLIDPLATIAHTQSKVLMVNGSTDEFFPLTAHVATYDAISGTEKRTSIAGNFDHGCYVLTGGESAQTIADRATVRANGGQRMWFGHWFGTKPDYAYVPAAPSVTLQAAGALTLVTAVVDDGGASLDVKEVKIWWSNDDAFLWGNVALSPAGGGVYSGLVAFPVQANTVSFVDALYTTKQLLGAEEFSLSSPPSLPAGFVPHVRNIQSCL